MTDAESYPRLAARTQRFRLGAPRDLTVSPDGSRVAFVRSAGSTDRVGRLWVLDVASGDELLVVDPVALLGDGEEDLPPEERARRERLREAAGGVTAYAVDDSGRVAAMALGGRIVIADLVEGSVRVLDVPGPVIDPRPSPDGALVAYAVAGSLHVVDAASGLDRLVAESEGAEVTYGLAEFVAAEEMSRYRGFWWAPGSDALLVARVDESPVQRWWISNPSEPSAEPVSVRYPAAGTPNAEVSLSVRPLDGDAVDVVWDVAGYPYVAAASWSGERPLLLVQSRDQRRTQTLLVDATSGETSVLRADSDEHWVELVPGVPALLPDGRLLHTVDDSDTRRLAVDGVPVSPVGLQVVGVSTVDEAGVLFRATRDGINTTVSTWNPATQAVELLPSPAVRPADWTVGDADDPVAALFGVHSARRGGPTTVFTSATLQWFGTRALVVTGDAAPLTIASYAADPPLTYATPRSIFPAGPHGVTTAVLLPRHRDAFPGPLPVVLDPYGGPGHSEVVGALSMWLEPQWLADQGFAVVVADGRGTPGRGPAWERAIAGGGWAEAVLEDQVAALGAAATAYPDDLDLRRVGIRGWSFGGYLAALAVLRRPDVFHAAVAGAPVTDWALYDTHYTERYLGDPAEHASWYAANSLIEDAGSLTRPLLLIHGLSDDNVVAANTLRLSSALMAAGRAHTVLPLSGVTHMTPQEIVAENLMLMQVDFLRSNLPPR